MIEMVALAVLAPQASKDISEYWQENLRDASFTARVGSANQRELAKINKDFANSYRFKSMSVLMKEPLKIRLESKVDDMEIRFIINNTTRRVTIPKSKINLKENLSTSPGKRQTVLDFGILTPSLFKDFFQAKFVRMDRESGVVVFDLTYVARLDDTTRHRVWIDPEKKLTIKREWYTQLGGYLLATFFYEKPVQQAGVWFPTQVSVRNADNKVAGTTHYDGIKLNSGIADSLFKID